jgi:hypothetical protein
MLTVMLMLLVGFGPAQDTKPAQENKQEQERPKVPKDSVELFVTGCLKGRVLAVSEVRQTDTTSGPDIRARSFRLSGKKPVMEDVKREDGKMVDVVGLIRKNDLREPGVKVGNTRVTVSGGSRPGGPTTIPDPADNVVVMDVSSVRSRGTSCVSK